MPSLESTVPTPTCPSEVLDDWIRRVQVERVTLADLLRQTGAAMNVELARFIRRHRTELEAHEDLVRLLGNASDSITRATLHFVQPIVEAELDGRRPDPAIAALVEQLRQAHTAVQQGNAGASPDPRRRATEVATFNRAVAALMATTEVVGESIQSVRWLQRVLAEDGRTAMTARDADRLRRLVASIELLGPLGAAPQPDDPRTN